MATIIIPHKTGDYICGSTQKMKPYIINVSEVEELQQINDKPTLNKFFEKAKSTIVNGEEVTLARKSKKGYLQKFDSITTLEDLEKYRKGVYKYL